MQHGYAKRTSLGAQLNQTVPRLDASLKAIRAIRVGALLSAITCIADASAASSVNVPQVFKTDVGYFCTVENKNSVERIFTSDGNYLILVFEGKTATEDNFRLAYVGKWSVQPINRQGDQVSYSGEHIYQVREKTWRSVSTRKYSETYSASKSDADVFYVLNRAGNDVYMACKEEPDSTKILKDSIQYFQQQSTIASAQDITKRAASQQNRLEGARDAARESLMRARELMDEARKSCSFMQSSFEQKSYSDALGYYRDGEKASEGQQQLALNMFLQAKNAANQAIHLLDTRLKNPKAYCVR